MACHQKPPEPITLAVSTLTQMSRHVTGIGGLFFRSDDHKALAKWYYDHFGINNEEHGWIWQQDAGPTVFSPFKRDTDYFASEKQQFMLNLRVQDLDGLLKKLEVAGVRIDLKRMDEDYGRFAWVYDPEGNKIELWEPKA
jgi:glyoxylase I family protein